jgi:hydrogenase nickel incorporation protein HypA/HybF
VHELSIAGAILDTARRHAGGRRVTLVSLRVGRLRQVVPDSLQFYWGIVTRDTECEQAQLAIEEIELRLHCSACGREWQPLTPVFHCGDCGGGEVSVRSGEELEVEYIEVEDPQAVTREQEEAACIGPR